jgi:hypothetical protein
VLAIAYCSSRPERRADGPRSSASATGESTEKATAMDEDAKPSKSSSPQQPQVATFRPEADPLMVFDPSSGRVIDKRNGDWFASQSTDREHGGMYFRIVNSNNELLYTFNTQWKLLVDGGKRVMSFTVDHAEKGRLPFPDSLQFAEDLSLERFGRFVRSHPQSSWLQAKSVIVIDNREKFRAKYRSGL